jgi:hypothetical protein
VTGAATGAVPLVDTGAVPLVDDGAGTVTLVDDGAGTVTLVVLLPGVGRGRGVVKGTGVAGDVLLRPDGASVLLSVPPVATPQHASLKFAW